MVASNLLIQYRCKLLSLIVFLFLTNLLFPYMIRLGL